MMELSYARDASFGFLPEDSRHLALDPLEHGDKALFITSQDGEGITLIGAPEELREFGGRLQRFLYYGGPSQPSQPSQDAEVVVDRLRKLVKELDRMDRSEDYRIRGKLHAILEE